MTILSEKHVFVIAEMANAHEGNLSKAKEIIEAAASCNADAIKFQKFTASELLTKDHEKFSEFKKLEMNNSQWKQIIKFSKIIYPKNLKICRNIVSFSHSILISLLINFNFL